MKALDLEIHIGRTIFFSRYQGEKFFLRLLAWKQKYYFCLTPYKRTKALSRFFLRPSYIIARNYFCQQTLDAFDMYSNV